jgi:hypothetical protein
VKELAMKKRFLLFCLLLSLPVFSGAGNDPLLKLQKEGWEVVQAGVLRRELKPNEVETFVFGEAGFTWKLQDLQAQLQVLRKVFQAHPTPELRRAIASHRRAVASTREMIERARAAEASGDAPVLKFGCDAIIHYNADASYKTDRQGTWADASADFYPPEGCSSGTGEVYAYAFAKTTVNGAPTTATVTDGPRSGANVSAAADANRNGGAPCESYAFASVTSSYLYPTSYSKSKTNESCPWPAPPYTSIVSDSPVDITLDEFECITITWTVSTSGGVPGYTTRIYSNGVFQKTGTSYSEEVCHDYSREGRYFDLTIRADVTDSAAQTSSASYTTKFFFYNWRP